MTSDQLAVAPTGHGPRFKVFADGLKGRSARSPVARAADVNSLIPDFKIEFGYNIVGGTIVSTPTGPTIVGGKLQLTSAFLFPFFKSFEVGPYGGCTHCVGSGRFGQATVKKTQFSKVTFFEKVVRGKIFMSKQTRFVQGVVSPDHIGRFKVYGLNTDPRSPHPIELTSGCTPANLDLSNDAVLLGWRTLPRVPCKQALPPNNSVSVNTPVELSETNKLQASITGHATGTQWLIIFQSQQPYASGQACGPNALAEELRAQKNFLEGQVSGSFDFGFQTGAPTAPGWFCAYLQIGGTLTVADGAKLPDGRVTATALRPFYVGDSASITGATTATAGQAVSETVSGTASTTEELYVFAPNAPCAGSAQDEFALDPHDLTATEHPGTYSFPLTVTIAAQPPPTVYVCAYLQTGAPSNGVPTGLPIVTASQAIKVG